MPINRLLPGFLPFDRDKSGGVKNYLNEETGQLISRRQYDKLRRPGFTNESLSKLNKEVEPEKAFARPARGKASVLKLPPELRKSEAERRKIDEENRKARAKALAEQKAVARKIEAAKHKKIKTPKKITGALLTAGAMGRTIEFGQGESASDAYPEYVGLYEQAKATEKIFSYSIGVDGVDSRTGKRYRATVFTMRGFDSPIAEGTFVAEIREFLESKRSYFVFTNYAMHLAFAVEYARAKKEKHGDKRKNKPGRKKRRD